MRKTTFGASILALCLFFGVSTAQAAQCGDGPGGFSTWLSQFKQEAVARGISPRAVSAALDGVTYNPTVIKLDRGQKSFRLSFEEFYAKRVSNAMINQGRKHIQNHGQMLGRIEQRTGVPPEIIMAIWGLETGYGRDSGNMSIFRSLATLAYDCRRSDFFTNELIHALMIVDRGDMQPSRMIGAWAGEIGQTQFLASSYIKFAVDGDGDGRRDLIRSVPDVLWSTASYLQAYGWQPGAGWEPGTHNYEVLRKWNKASVYVQTISVMAQKMRQG
ncbi:lytic murein transglycosylase [Lutibaculum baratangense]|uniref:Membrane-bound lytic murein transglycosylase B n=1 Tax=Lutibaculum baratangense AMV1 TaxID=631454 RepID=V4R2F5_9HYPH|nr:lytic murein transglycosylase [Lutibaculum baratangense]ESR26137.1 Membrane-bound lytic murein transglycosylase B precursor [Lutibaculum baratangense AMV1]